MSKQYLTTENAPAAIGPYSQAVRVGQFVYTSGQGGLDPTTNKMVAGGVSEQAEQTMQNLQSVLAAAGLSMENVIKTNIYLRYIKDFQAVNEVYARYFPGQKPARSTVAVSALPLSALVEIEMIAFAPEIETLVEETKVKLADKKPKKKGKKKKKAK